jgi:molybdopterin synthase sulfur carrier subunit
MTATLDILYFAWLRERTGLARERVQTGAATVAALVEELAARSEGHALAFEDRVSIRVAVDQELAEMSSPLAGAREVAFFPPMTGG